MQRRVQNRGPQWPGLQADLLPTAVPKHLLSHCQNPDRLQLALQQHQLPPPLHDLTHQPPQRQGFAGKRRHGLGPCSQAYHAGRIPRSTVTLFKGCSEVGQDLSTALRSSQCKCCRGCPDKQATGCIRGCSNAARCSTVSPAALYLLNLLYELGIPDADRKCGPWKQRPPRHGNSKHLQSNEARWVGD